MLKALKTGIALAIASGTLTAANAAPLSTWYGDYVYEHALGRTGVAPGEPGIAIFVTYKLRLGPGNGATGCRLDAEGYQTYQQLQCTATPEGESVIIKFYKFGPDNAGGRYAMGERLVTLTRSGRNIATQWQALSPEGGTPRMAFRRTR